MNSAIPAPLHPDVLEVALIERYATALADLAEVHGLTRPVPTCGEWTLADLVWHLFEVEDFWAFIIANRPAGPDGYDEPARPTDDLLIAGLRDAARRLTDALRDADRADEAWSWSDDRTVGFTVRRQIHEALIHLLDGALATGQASLDVDPRLAADGVDELLRVMVGGVPDWADFRPTSDVIRISAADTGDRWTLTHGRMTGVSPHSGRSYDLDAYLPGASERPSGELTATAWELDRWLWGRAASRPGSSTGPERLWTTLRTTISDSTQ